MRQQRVHSGEQSVRRIPLLLFLGFLLCERGVRGIAVADECAGTITAKEALSAEDARYKAQAANDVAAMERLFGPDLVYIHSSAARDTKTSYIESMRSGTVKYRRSWKHL